MRRTGLVLGGALGLVLSLSAQGPIPVHEEPHHRVVFENGQLRIFDVLVPPKGLTRDHRHDHDIATVSISAADTRTISPGQPWGPVRPRRDVGHAQTTEYTGKPGNHAIENVGDSPYRLLAVENLRDGNWSTGAPLTAAATSLAIESRAFRIYDVRLGNEAPLARHVHQTPAVAVLASGAVVADTDQNPRRLGAPGQWVLIRPGELHRLTAPDGSAHVVEIELR